MITRWYRLSTRLHGRERTRKEMSLAATCRSIISTEALKRASRTSTGLDVNLNRGLYPASPDLQISPYLKLPSVSSSSSSSSSKAVVKRITNSSPLLSSSAQSSSTTPAKPLVTRPDLSIPHHFSYPKKAIKPSSPTPPSNLPMGVSTTSRYQTTIHTLVGTNRV